MACGEAVKHYLEIGPEPDLGNGMLAVRSFKLILDGALGSRGAEMTEAYTDAPEDHGLQLVKDAELDQVVRAARRRASGHASGANGYLQRHLGE